MGKFTRFQKSKRPTERERDFELLKFPFSAGISADAANLLTRMPIYNKNTNNLSHYNDFYSRAYIHGRAYQSKNRFQAIPGTNQLWREPSGYLRYEFGIVFKGTGTYTFSHPDYQARNTVVAPDEAWRAWNNEPYLVPSWWNNPASLSNPKIASSFDVINTRNFATAKALNDLGDSKAQLGEALATARQTSSMIVNAAADILQLYKDTRNGKLAWKMRNLNVKQVRSFVKSGKLAKTAANRWLEFHYGWKPLASDIHGAYELLNSLFDKNPALLVNGSGVATLEHRSQGLRHRTYPNIGLLLTSEALLECRVEITARIKDSDYDRTKRTLNRLGLLNPASLAWELIPFSFVLDWFIPVGSMLQMMSDPVGLTFQGGTETYRYGRVSEATVAADSDPSNDKITTQFRYYGTDRYKLTGFPRPTLSIRPFYSGPDRIATILALFEKLRVKKR